MTRLLPTRVRTLSVSRYCVSLFQVRVLVFALSSSDEYVPQTYLAGRVSRGGWSLAQRCTLRALAVSTLTMIERRFALMIELPNLRYQWGYGRYGALGLGAISIEIETRPIVVLDNTIFLLRNNE